MEFSCDQAKGKIFSKINDWTPAVSLRIVNGIVLPEPSSDTSPDENKWSAFLLNSWIVIGW